MTLREIRSNCGNLQDETLHARLLNSSGLFLDFSWVTVPAQSGVQAPGQIGSEDNFRVATIRLDKEGA